MIQSAQETPTPATHCMACGKLWVDHPGVVRTCEALLEKCREVVALEAERDALLDTVRGLEVENDRLVRELAAARAESARMDGVIDGFDASARTMTVRVDGPIVDRCFFIGQPAIVAARKATP